MQREKPLRDGELIAQLTVDLRLSADMSQAMRKLLVVVSGMLIAACGHANSATVTSKSAVGRCIDRLIEKSRAAGYTEVAVDRDISFFRVASKDGPDPTRKNPGIFFSVQCQGDDRALISVLDDRGLFDDDRPLNEKLGDELDHYRKALRDF